MLFLALALILLTDSKGVEKISVSRGNSYIEGLKIVNKKDGNEVWVLNAKRADIIESENKAKLYDIVMEVRQNGLVVKSDDGIYDISNKSLILKSTITAETNDYTIITDTVEWTPSGEIKTGSDVRVLSKKFNVEGEGMCVDSGQKVRILKNVKAIFY
jgi:hypothetical protein